MSVKMKFGSKDIPFVYKGDKLVYPNPIKDGLLLWYDFKGMRNTDMNKEAAKDLSENGNDGTLTNFNFTEGSGYKDNTLVFDGVDDSLTIPELELDETAMSVVHDGKLYAYEDDKVLTVGGDGEIVEIGFNLLSNSTQWVKGYGDTYIHKGTTYRPYGYAWGFLFYVDLVKDQTYTISVPIFNPSETEPSPSRIYVGHLGNFVKLVQPLETLMVSHTFKAQENEEQAVIRFLTNGHNFPVLSWSYPKMEKGDRATKWIPSPQDYKTTTLTTASITDLQLYNKTLRKDELLHNAESKGLKKLKPGVVVQDGLVLHYDFSHESNTSEYKDKAFDYSGNGNHGELQNFNFTEESGYDGDKLLFDGVDDFVKTPPNLLGGLNSITVSVTLKIIASVDRLDGFLMMGTGTGRVWIRAVGSQLSGNTYFGQSAFDFSTVFSNNILEAGVMSLTLVIDRKGKQSSYLNGSLTSEREISAAADIPIHSGETILGRTSVGYSQPNAEYYDVKIYHKALSPEEIAHNYEIEKEKFDIIEGEM